MDAYLGIDIAKDSLAVVLLRDRRAAEAAQFENNPTGFGKLHRFLTKRKLLTLHACLEATGSYGDALALFLYEAGYTVSVVNPARIHGYAESRLSRTKTDATDAALGRSAGADAARRAGAART